MILVTGAFGFIGSYVVRLLSARGDLFGVVDCETRAAVNASSVRSLPGFVGEVNGRVEERSTWDALPDGITSVVHLAAESHVDESIRSPAVAFRSNGEGTMLAALWASKKDLPFVYVSTDEVYGDVEGSGRAAVEDDPPRPSSPYSAGKAAGEHAVSSVARTFGLRAVVVRGNNAWGVGQLREKYIPIVCACIGRGEEVPLHGGGRSSRQWVNVEEFAECVLLSLDRARVARRSAVPDVFNVSGPDRLTIREVAELFGARHEDVPDRLGQDLVYWTDGGKAAKMLGFVAKRSLRDEGERRALLDAYGDGAPGIVVRSPPKVEDVWGGWRPSGLSWHGRR